MDAPDETLVWRTVAVCEWFAPEIPFCISGNYQEISNLLPDFCQRYWLRPLRFSFMYVAVSMKKVPCFCFGIRHFWHHTLL